MSLLSFASARAALQILLAAGSITAGLDAHGQTIQEYRVGGNWRYGGVATGADGNLWFTEGVTGWIASYKPGGTVALLMPPGIKNPGTIIRGPDNRIWFAENGKIAAINSDHSIVEFAMDPECVMYSNFTTDSTSLWFSESCSESAGVLRADLVQITTAGSMTKYIVGTDVQHQIYSVVEGTDGNIWFAEYVGNVIGKYDKAKAKITEFAIPTSDSGPLNLVVGPDSSIWFFENKANKLSRIDSGGNILEFAWHEPIPQSVILGPDNKLWSVGQDMQVIRTSAAASGIVPSVVPGKNELIGFSALTLGRDGNLWFSEEQGLSLGVIRMDGIFVDDFEGNPSP